MKLSKLIPILQGIYSSDPEAQIFFELDSHYAKKLAKASFVEDNFFDAFSLDIEKISLLCDDGETNVITLELMSTGYSEDEVNRLAKEFDIKIKKL